MFLSLHLAGVVINLLVVYAYTTGLYKRRIWSGDENL